MKRLYAITLALLLAAALPAVAASAAGFNPDGKYRLIQPPQPTETTQKGQVEVVDIFWFGCPHCYHFLPHMEAWLKHKPKYVLYRRMPAIFNAEWALHARAFYVAKVLGVADKIYRPLFDAMHKQGLMLNTKASLADWFTKYGVSKAEFDNTWDSFTVNALVNKSQVMQEKYGVEGTPSVVINGKYLTSGSLAGNYDTMIKVIQALVEREHKAEMGG